jgi:four helix bundle protein
MYLAFEELDLYQVALDFVVSADDVAQKQPRGRRYLKDQLLRAATSIAANIAEGVGEHSPAEKVRFYRIARPSTVEYASHFLVSQRLGPVHDEALLAQGQDQLLWIVAVLRSLARSISEKNPPLRQRQRYLARA